MKIVEADFKRPLTRDAFLWLIANLRAEDLAEIEAVRGPFDPQTFGVEIMQSRVRAWLVYNPAPVATVGFFPMTPTCAGFFAFGTEHWPLVVKGMTRQILRDIIPLTLSLGFHRAECRALASRHDVRRWLNGLGWRAEAVLSEFGSRREDFILYAWTAPHEAHGHHQGERSGTRELSACDG